MRIKLLLTALAMLPVPAFAADHLDECCKVVAIDAQKGTIRLELGDSGKTFTLQIGSNDLLGSMQVGQSLGFEGQDDWESLEEGDSLTPVAEGDWDPNDFEECCTVVGDDFELGPELLATRQLADGITFEVVEMRRVNKNVLHFTFAIDNQTEEPVNPMDLGLMGWVGSGPTMTANQVQLHDLIGLKRYSAGTASSGRDLNVPPFERREFWAQYQAPPKDVNALTVVFADAPPLYEVAIR